MSRQDHVLTVTGEVDRALRAAFEDVEVTVDQGVTRLRVVGADASVLYGVLHRIDALGVLELLDLYRVEGEGRG